MPQEARSDIGKPKYEGVLQAYLTGIHGARPQTHTKSVAVVCPENFSLIDNPDESLRTLNEFASKCAGRPEVISIDQSSCSHIDLCAASVLNALARAAAAHSRSSRSQKKARTVRFSGRFPSSLECSEIVAATGLPNELGVQLHPQHADAMGKFSRFRLVQGRFTGHESRKSSVCDVHTTSLINYLNECLGKCRFRLTPDTVDRLSEIIAEIINNAEDHSLRHEWWVSGYMRQSAPMEVGDCHLTIFNFGRSIAESLQTLPVDSKLSRDIHSILGQRRLGKKRDPRQEEAAWTVFALQPRVSRKNTEKDSPGNRGQGTVKLIEFFDRIGRTGDGSQRPEMALVSGRTHISFGRYHLQEKPEVNGERPRIIAFNRSNDLSLPPDPGAVRLLNHRFPGTLISLRFFFDPRHLVKVDEVVPSD